MCMIMSIVLVGTIRFCWRLLCRYNVNEAYFHPTLIMAPFHSETPPCAPLGATAGEEKHRAVVDDLNGSR